MKLAIITVNYKTYSLTEEFLDSLDISDLDQKQDKIYVIDVSPDKIPIKTRKFIAILEAENKGYAHGINVGLKQAQKDGYENFIVMNNDTIVDAHFCSSVKTSLEKNKDSIIGGKIYYFPGFEYHRERYKKSELGHVLWYAGGQHDWKNVTTKHIGVDKIDDGTYSEITETNFVTGCLVIFNSTVLKKVGFWDESYFLYYEDSDWCERARSKKIPLLFDPSIIIWHKNAQSTGGAGSDLHRKYQERNRLLFGLKYAPLRTKAHLIKNYFSGLKLLQKK